MKPDREHNEFRLTRLADVLQSSSFTANTIGMVVSTHSLKKTSASKNCSHLYSASFTIVDPERQDASSTVSVNWFFNTPEGETIKDRLVNCSRVLPEMQIGDVVLVLNARCQMYNDKKQLSANENKSSLIVLHSKHTYAMGRLLPPFEFNGSAGNPFHSDDWEVSLLYHPRNDSDAREFPPRFARETIAVIQRAERFLQSVSLQTLVYRGLSWVQQIRQKVANNTLDLSACPEPGIDNFDTICLVLKVFPPTLSTVARFIAWDGTGAASGDSFASLANKYHYSQEELQFMRESFQSTVIDTMSFVERHPLTIDVLDRYHQAFRKVDSDFCGVPVVFTATDMGTSTMIERLDAGQWVRVMSAAVNFSAGVEDVFLKPDSHITPLPCISIDATNLCRLYLNALRSKPVHSSPSRQKLQSPAPVLRPAQNQITPLMTIWTSQAPAAFRTQVQVIDWFPRDINEFVVDSATGDRKFMFGLKLRDQIHSSVILYDQEAETFLGVTAREFDQNVTVRQDVQENLQKLQRDSSPFVAYLKLYLVGVESENNVSVKATSKKRGRSNIKSSDQNTSASNGMKRLAMFRTIAPFAK